MTRELFDLAEIGRGLPVAGHEDELREAIFGEGAPGAVVVQAPPGTGKTTFLPPLLANEVSGKVICVAPRRVAVRAAAHRLHHLAPTVPGVGFTIRGEQTPSSRVEFLTPGVLLRRMLHDPELSGVDAVIVDEVHERQLDTDIVLGMLVELRELRDDLRLVAMSATVESSRFAALIGGDVVTITSPIYPLEVSYAPIAGRAECSRGFLSELARASREAAVASSDSVLVFVPGVREVRIVVEALECDPRLPHGIEVYPLHGSLSSPEQDAALRADSQRIVVATSIAESSITVPGVRTVVDSGLSRVPKRDNLRGMTGLVTISTSQSSVEQRAGRAGREGPGTVVRCYSASDFQHFPAAISPEIASADLTQASLFVSAWGGSFDSFPLLDAPPARAVEQAQATLEQLGAVDEHGLTTIGKKLVALPTDPRLGRALLEAGSQAAPVIASLGEDVRGDVDRELPRLTALPRVRREIARLKKLSTDRGKVATGTVVGLAFPSLIARNMGKDYQLASGTRVLAPDFHAEWIAVADVSLGNIGTPRVRAAAVIDEEQALAILGVKEEVKTSLVDGRVRGTLTKKAGAIVLSSIPCAVGGDVAKQALAKAISEEGLGLFVFSEKAQGLLDRLRLLHEAEGDPWPDVERVDPLLWLGPELDALAQGKAASGIDMYPALQRLLPWPEAARLGELTPERLEVPSGRSVAIDYSGERPVVRVKLQECFGLESSPVICGKPVQFHLLSPAGRPLAVTDDLASFWAGPYHGVRAEMRGRYPKHPWPEDPTTAVATAKTNRRLSK